MAAKYNQPSGGEWDELNHLIDIIIGSAIEVHRYFGQVCLNRLMKAV